MNRNDDAIIASRRLVELAAQVPRPKYLGETQMHASIAQGLAFKLQVAVQSRQPQLINAMLNEAGSYETFSTDSLADLLILAAYYGFEDCVEILLKHGAPVNAQSVSGQTPLMRAVGGRSLATIHLLLSAGADRSMRTLSGMSALDMAIALGSDQEIINVLQEVNDR